MDNVDFKLLKKLAAECRKAGIKSYKGNGIEFTLADSTPVSKSRRTKKSSSGEIEAHDMIPTDLPGGDALLFWSVENDLEKPSDQESE